MCKYDIDHYFWLNKYIIIIIIIIIKANTEVTL